MKKLKYFILGMCVFLLMGTTLRPTQVGYKGDIKGIVCGYSDADTVTISAGYCDCNGTLYTQAAATTHDITSGADTQNVYFFIDDSASTRSAIVFRSEDSGVETPAWSEAKQGWYSDQTVADRVVGAAYCTGAATMSSYTVNGSGNVLKVVWSNWVQIASNMNPNDTWLTPDDNESSVYFPVNVVEGFFRLYAKDTDPAPTICVAYITNKELADLQATNYLGATKGIIGWSSAVLHGWIPLSTSRNVRISGNDDDENSLNCYIKGFAYSR